MGCVHRGIKIRNTMNNQGFRIHSGAIASTMTSKPETGSSTRRISADVNLVNSNVDGLCSTARIEK